MPDTAEPQLDELRRRARRRLVGAIVLALAAAVLVPMLLESEPKPLGEDVAVRIPPIDEGKFVSKVGEKARPPEPAVKPLAPKPAESTSAAKEPAAPPKPVASAAPPPTEPAATAKAPPEPPKVAVAAPAKAPEAPPAEAQKSVAKPGSGSFSVQLAAFADDKGANALANRLKKAGHPAYTEPYTTSRGTLWRVRVGPYPTRDAAESAREKLKSEGQSGIVAAAG